MPCWKDVHSMKRTSRKARTRTRIDLAKESLNGGCHSRVRRLKAEPWRDEVGERLRRNPQAVQVGIKEQRSW
jgi:hypothetical protein